MLHSFEEEWLDTKLNYPIDNKHYVPLKEDVLYYYNKNNKDIKKNNKREIELMRSFRDNIMNNNPSLYDRYYHKELIRNSNYVNRFLLNNKSYIHYIDQDTPRYLCSVLFNKLIDYCLINNLFDFDNKPIINKEMREEFYKFCFNKSY